MPKREIGFRQQPERDTATLFARIPRAEADKLERAAFELKTSKQSIIASLLRALDVERDEWTVGRATFRPTAAEVLTLEQLAELLQLDEKTVAQLARRGEIPGRKLGREWRFSREAVLEWLRGEDAAARRRRDRKQPARKARE